VCYTVRALACTRLGDVSLHLETTVRVPVVGGEVGRRVGVAVGLMLGVIVGDAALHKPITRHTVCASYASPDTRDGQSGVV